MLRKFQPDFANFLKKLRLKSYKKKVYIYIFDYLVLFFYYKNSFLEEENI